MKAAALMNAQLRGNPQLIDTPRHYAAGMRLESIPVPRRGRRRRRS